MSSGDQGAPSGAPAPTLAELAGQIRTEITAAEDGHRAALGHAIRAGELLHEAKGRVGHGEWLPWLEDNFGATRKTAAAYMRLAANVTRVSHLDSVREALAEVARINRESRPPQRRAEPARKADLWDDDDVVAWVARRMKAGRTRDQIFQESQAGDNGWPAARGLSQNGVDIVRAIVEDRLRRGDTTRRRQPKESGRRLRELHAERRAGRTGDLWHLQKATAEAAGMLEGFALPDLDWSEENEAIVIEIYDDLMRHARWNEAAIDAVTAHMDELGRQRKISQLRARADDPSSTQAERETAARLADKLIAKQAAARLSS